MITVYHLSTSRSERIIWLMEELGEPYDLVRFERVNGRFAPPEMRAIHPLSKAPTVRDSDLTLIESGAIVEYIVERYGHGRLRPQQASEDYGRYLQWLHFAEGSLMPALIQTMVGSGRFGAPPAPDQEARKAESDRYLDFVESELGGRTHFVGSDFTAADVMMTYALKMVGLAANMAKYPNITRYLGQIAERPNFKSAMAIANPPADRLESST